MKSWWKLYDEYLKGTPGVLVGIAAGVAVSGWMMPYAEGYNELQRVTDLNQEKVVEHESQITALQRETSSIERTMDQINRNLRIAVCTRSGEINRVAYQELNCSEFE